MTVTSKLHTQEYRETELNIVIDEIGPGEGRLKLEGETENMGVCTKECIGDDERRWVLKREGGFN